MKHLVGKTAPMVDVDFMGDKVKVKKLSVSEVRNLQKELEALQKKAEKGDDAAELGILGLVIRATVDGADEISDEELYDFPLADLAELGTKVMEVSGVQGASGN